MTDQLASIWNIFASRPRLSALVFGAISATAYPPLHLWPVGLIGFAAFAGLLKAASGGRRAALLGWLFGWAHLGVANNWIATAFTYQAEMPAALGWVAVPLLCIYLAVYPSLAALAAHRVGCGAKWPAFIGLLASAWIVTEWLRSWVFTGYPWPPLGLMVLGGWEHAGVAVVLPWLGTYGLSGAVVLIAGALAAFAAQQRWGAIVASSVLLAVLMHWPAPDARESDVRYTLVQPLIPQEEITDASKYEEQFARAARLTTPGREERRLVLWPESSVPDYLEDGYPQRYYDRSTAGANPQYSRQRIGSLIGDGNLLLAGLTHLDIGEVEGERRALSARNSVSAIDSKGNLRLSYAKAHLVPYGEYLPLKWLLEPLGLTRLVAGGIEFKPGPGPRTMDLGEFGKAGIQICYEIVFSGQGTERGRRPDYIFNPSNDGWFGKWGPPQHLAQARMRAIEEGLPVLRSTTTGISAVIDANGIVRGWIGRGRADRIDGMIPMAKPPTLFSMLGNVLPLIWALLIGAVSLVAMRRSGG